MLLNLTLAFGQQEPTQNDNTNYLTNVSIKIDNDKDYKGSHYDHDQFQNGIVYKMTSL